MSKVLVCVRVRPLNRRELLLNSPCVVAMKGHETVLMRRPEGASEEDQYERRFTFDYSFWSAVREDPHYIDQPTVFNSIGKGVLENSFAGYNACIFAYGQTGSGKSYTMMGPEDDKGLIPRLCESMFQQIDENTDSSLSFKVEVSYMEIYNEKVRDLLGDVQEKKSLKVREHSVLGPYVEGLSKFAVKDFKTIIALIEEGNRSRTVASTNMNAESSRSHAVFTLVLTQAQFDSVSGHTGEKVSRISLVDLAGSERAGKTGVTGDRLKEGSNINKSLTTLGLVISALADISSNKKKSFVPYRDSTLTWLLKDNLGGNSKTVMVATISPAVDNYEESLSTLRYADRAKRIVNHAVVNEDPNARLIRELRAEVDQLRLRLGTGAPANMVELDALRDQLRQSEMLMQEMSMTWEEKLKLAETAMKERQKQLEIMGISVHSGGIAVDKNKYYLVNISADPSLDSMLVYYLKDDVTYIGSPDAPHPQDIVLTGAEIAPEHARLIVEPDGEMYIEALPDARVFVNGHLISARTRLRHGSRILLGSNHFFRANCPRRPDDTEQAMSTGTDAVGVGDGENPYWAAAVAELSGVAAKSPEQWIAERQAALEQQKREYDEKLAMMSAATPAKPSKEVVASSIASSTATIRAAYDRLHSLFPHISCKVVLRLTEQALYDHLTEGEVYEPAVAVQNNYLKEQVLWSVPEFMDKVESISHEIEAGADSRSLGVDETRSELIGIAHICLKPFMSSSLLQAEVSIFGLDGRPFGTLTATLETTVESAQERVGPLRVGDTLSCSFRVAEMSGLQKRLKNYEFCFCEYRFGGNEVVIPELERVVTKPRSGTSTMITVRFERRDHFKTIVDQDLLAQIATGHLSIKVRGHNKAFSFEGRAPSPTSQSESARGSVAAQPASSDLNEFQRFTERWRNHTHSFNLLELDGKSNNYMPVPVGLHEERRADDKKKSDEQKYEFLLRQGYPRRFIIRLWQTGGPPLPIGIANSVLFGDICVDGKRAEGAASVSEDCLELAKARCHAGLEDRIAKFDDEVRALDSTTATGPVEVEKSLRRNILVKRKMELVWERTVLQSSDANICIMGTGGPSVTGYEQGVNAVYIPLDKGSPPDWSDNSGKYLPLVIVNQDQRQEGLEIYASWDAAVHDNAALLRPSENESRIVMTLQVRVALQGYDAEVTFSKKIAFRIYKHNHSFKGGFFSIGRQKQFANTQGCGSMYQVITSVPQFDDDDISTAADDVATEFFRSIESMRALLQIDQLKTLASIDILEAPTRTKGSLSAVRSPDALQTSQRQLIDMQRDKQQLLSKIEAADASGREDDKRTLQNALYELNDNIRRLSSPEPRNEVDWEFVETEDTTRRKQSLARLSGSFSGSAQGGARRPGAAGSEPSSAASTSSLPQVQPAAPVSPQSSLTTSAPAPTAPTPAAAVAKPLSSAASTTASPPPPTAPAVSLGTPASASFSPVPSATPAQQHPLQHPLQQSPSPPPVPSQQHGSSQPRPSAQHLPSPLHASVTTPGAASGSSTSQLPAVPAIMHPLQQETSTDPLSAHASRSSTPSLKPGDGKDVTPSASSLLLAHSASTDDLTNLKPSSSRSVSPANISGDGSKPRRKLPAIPAGRTTPRSEGSPAAIGAAAAQSAATLTPAPAAGVAVTAPPSAAAPTAAVSDAASAQAHGSPIAPRTSRSGAASPSHAALETRPARSSSLSRPESGSTAHAATAPLLHPQPHPPPPAAGAPESAAPLQQQQQQQQSSADNKSPPPPADGSEAGSASASLLSSPATQPRSLHDPSGTQSPTLSDKAVKVSGEDDEADDNQCPDMPDLGIEVGARVVLGDNKNGLLRFYGRTHFGQGLWVGVELDKPTGKNDGSVDGIAYFLCANKHGVFVRPDKVKKAPELPSRAKSFTARRGSSMQTS